MQFNALRLALFAVVAAAVPHDSRDLRSCHNNIALSALKILRASAFCSSYIHIETATCVKTTTVTRTQPATVSATVTATNGQTVTSTSTAVVEAIITTVIDGPTNTVTLTITDTATITSPQTITKTTTPTVTVTSYARTGSKKREVSPRHQKPKVPQALKYFAERVISTACSCYVPRPTVTKTSTITKTLHPTTTLSFTATVSPVVATAVQTVTSTSSTTTTSTRPPTTSTATENETINVTVRPTTTVTQAAPAVTVTVPGRTYNYLYSFTAKCVPFNYLTLNYDIPDIPLTYDALFQWCAAKCAADSSCVQIWLAYNNPITRAGLWCMTGGGPEHKTWVSEEIQCDYPPIGQFGEWYTV